MADQYWANPIGPFHTATGAAFNTFTTRQDVSPVPLPVVYPPMLHLGSKIKIEAEGEFSTTGTPTLSIGTYIGTQAGVITTVLAEYTAAATGSGAAAWQWRLEWRGLVAGPIGTACQVTGTGTVELGTSLTAFSTQPIPSTAALRTVTWDTTLARAIGICATWGASSASNSIKTYNLSVLLMN
jgi:hypothetical protein